MFVARRTKKKHTPRRIDRSREIGFIFLLSSALILAFFLIFGDSGYFELQKKERLIRQLELVRDSHVERNRQLEKEIDRLKNDLTRIEELARQELKLTKQSDIVIQLQEPAPKSPASR